MNYLPASSFCSDYQLSNLNKLLDFLKSGKAKTSFNMGVFINTYTPMQFVISKFVKVNPKVSRTLGLFAKNNCLTVCCLAGHGPLAGVKPLEGELWPTYVRRVFTGGSKVFTNGSKGVYAFLFSPYWVDYQPTKEEAIFRLELFLKKGLPEGFVKPVTGMRPIIETPLLNFRDECRLGVHTLD